MVLWQLQTCPALGCREEWPKATSLRWPWEAVCAQATDGIRILPQLPPCFQRSVNKLLSFTTSNLLPSLDVLLLSRARQEPSAPFALVCHRGKRDGSCPLAQGPRGVMGRDCSVSPCSPAWVESPSYNWVITASPRQLTLSMKRSQSVINYMRRVEGGSEVSNSFVQGLTMRVSFAWPCAAHADLNPPRPYWYQGKAGPYLPCEIHKLLDLMLHFPGSSL